MADHLESKLLREYPVWDKPVRIFHWVNVLCILGLIAIGVIILNNKALGISSDGKILLKTWHVYFGYVFVINLIIRIVWGFIGNRYARWRSILPKGEAYKKQLADYMSSFKKREAIPFLGHNPLARLMVSLLFLLLSLQALTGLVLAGTDVYMLPFGDTIKQWVAIDETTVNQVQPYSKQGVDEASYQSMRSFREPFITLHYYTFYLLVAAIIIHILGSVITELREKNGIISAMFTGKKVFKDKPVDFDD